MVNKLCFHILWRLFIKLDTHYCVPLCCYVGVNVLILSFMCVQIHFFGCENIHLCVCVKIRMTVQCFKREGIERACVWQLVQLLQLQIRFMDKLKAMVYSDSSVLIMS